MIKKILLGIFVFASFVLSVSNAHAKVVSFSDYLYYSVRRGNLSQVRMLLNKGYSIDAINHEGLTALCSAAMNRDFSTYKKLLRMGASKNHSCMKKVDNGFDYYEETNVIENKAEDKIFGSDFDYTTAAIVGGTVLAGGIAAIVLSDGGSTKKESINECPQGEHLVDGKCIVCPDGADWTGSECVCRGDTYLEGNICVCPLGTRRVGDTCEPIICPEDAHLEGNECVCDGGKRYENGECVVKCGVGQVRVGDTCVTKDCPDGMILQDGVCVYDANICPAGTHKEGDKCVSDAIECSSGKKLVNGKCEDIVCPTGTHLVGDECVVIDQTCPTGKIFSDGECKDIVCGVGKILKGDVCEDIFCETGTRLVGNECVNIICEEGYHLDGNDCKPDDDDCPNGQIKRGDVCEYVSINCPVGTVIKDGQCVPIECPNNTKLVGNICVVVSQDIINEGDKDVSGVFSDTKNIYNLVSIPRNQNEEATIKIYNEGSGSVYGIMGFDKEVTNSIVIKYDGNEVNKKYIGTGNIVINDEGSGTVYGLYSTISDITVYSESKNAYSDSEGVAIGNIKINHTGGGKTYGLSGDVRTFNAYSNLGGSSVGNIDISADGDIYGIFGYVAAFNGASAAYGHHIQGNINLDSVGNGDVYGLAISKDNSIPGAGTGGGNIANWFAFNSYSAGSLVEGNINIRNIGTGTSYGMYGGQQLYNARSFGGKAVGNINIANLGNGNAYGMYMPEADINGIIANTTDENATSSINIVNKGDGIATGIRAAENVRVANSGDININNVGNGTAVGIYGERYSEIENSGVINIYRKEFVDSKDGAEYSPETEIGGTAYGIYAEKGARVYNDGIINIENAKNGAGIYLEEGASLRNDGVVVFNGTTNSVTTGSSLDLYNEGSTLANADLNSLGGGNITLGLHGQFFAESISGNLNVSEDHTLGSFEDKYYAKNAINADNVENLNLISDSGLFDAKTEDNGKGYDVVLTRKKFGDVVANKDVAEFFELNYKEGNNLELFDKVKSLDNVGAISKFANSYTGNDVLPSFREEDSLVHNKISKQLNEELFDKPDEHFVGGYKYIDVSRDAKGALIGNDVKANVAYGMVKGKGDSGITYGIGATVYNLKTNYDNGSKRKNNVFGLWLPVGYEFGQGTKWFSKAYVGYGDGNYDRKYEGNKHSADISTIQYALSNELRHDIVLGNKLNFTPVAELNLFGMHQNSFSEGDESNDLYVDSTDNISLEGGVGAYLSKEMLFNDEHKMSIRIGGIYYIEFMDPSDGASAHVRGMAGKYKLSSENGRNRAVLSAKIGYSYKNITLYGELEKTVGNKDDLVIDAGLQYNL